MDIAKVHFEFTCAEDVSIFAHKRDVRLVLAPLNLKPLALICLLPHASWLVGNEMCRTSFSAMPSTQFVSASQ